MASRRAKAKRSAAAGPLVAPPEGSPAASMAHEASALSFAPDQVADIPSVPGVYLMRDAKGEVLYVGKSVDLRGRVRQYFAGATDARLNVEFLRRRVATIDIIATRTDKEALLLEIGLIQRHRPRYNFRLTDDKSFFSIRLDHAKEFPRLEFVRTRAAAKLGGKKVEFFGPFHSSDAVKRTISELLRLFPLRSCTDAVLNNRTRPCILHDIGKCCAPCVLDVRQEEYRALVEGARRLLQGRRDDAIRMLEKEMLGLSERMEYERAAVMRDRIAAVRATVERQSVAEPVAVERDVVAFDRRAGKILFVVHHHRGGTIAETSRFLERDPGDPDDEIMAQFLAQFYAGGWHRPPREVLVSVAPPESAALGALLDERRLEGERGRVQVAAPVRGARRAEVELALANAREMLERDLAGEQTRDDILAQLAERLGLAGPPRHVECFDISTFQGSSTVGVCIVFRDGEPDTSSYRKFIVRGERGTGVPDDFAAMREVLDRRYSRLLREGGDLPDLVLIDGGKGQLAQAVEVARSLGMHSVALAGIAKSRVKTPADAPSDAEVRTEERLFLPGRKNPVVFKRNAPELFLVQRMRDEAHRFAIAFHRDRRRRGTLRSGLEDIPGIGPGRRRKLLRAFGSLAAIRAASAEELRERGGLPAGAARAVAEHFQEKPMD